MTTPAVTVSTPTDREIVLVRSFNAPPGLVFDAFTRPELLVRWFGARGWNLVECDVDLRVGGAWRYVSRGPGGDTMAHGGTYLEVDPPDRLAFTELFDDQSYPGESVITHEFVARGGRTTVTSTVLYATPEGRDKVLRYPMVRGVTESHERLDEVLAELSHSECPLGTDKPSERREGRFDHTRGTTMNWTLEVVVVPVSDVDRSKAFYADQLGFNVDHDTVINENVRVVQLTPPGSGCSVVIGKGAVPDMPPGSLKGLQLVVADLHKAREQLVERGVEVSEIQKMGENPVPGMQELDNVGFLFFSDPDGNGWAVQQISTRA
jgi:uncharacterized protein YndB with AHSA1/START domain/catechol 2,3-dioxygenase-like lactoylglutathione lyase family enzyme